jgi:hypothetical protein
MQLLAEVPNTVERSTPPSSASTTEHRERSAAITIEPVTGPRLWAGRVASALVVLFLIFDGAIKLVKIAPVTESFARLGYPDSSARLIGGLELALIALYVVRRTSVLGAVLLTGLLGGAVATHLRVGDPVASHVLFPTYVGALLWGGLFLRDARLRVLLPLAS